jgi:hypothetical protein
VSRLINSRPKRVFWAVLALVLILSPSLYTLGWHLRHGSVLAYKDKHVTIPLGWIADAEPQGLDITQLPTTIFTILSSRWIFGGMHLYKGGPIRNQTLQQAEESFEKGVQTYFPVSAHAVISGPIQMGTPPNDIFCMQITAADQDLPVSLHCMLQEGVWGAQFVGNERDVEIFYALLRSLQ